jgi:hypothetical protein
MFLFGLQRLVEGGRPLGEALVGAAVLLLIAAYMAIFLGRLLRHRGPVLIFERAGIRDLRRDGALIAWEEIEAASVKRPALIKGLKLELTGGRKLELDMGLLDGTPEAAMAIIRRQGGLAVSSDKPNR